MSLKNMFQAMRKEGYVTAPLDKYLFEQANKPNDRAVNVNAPSQAGGCLRANYYMRTQVDKDNTLDPRTQRIFDNGTYTHERLQTYLLDMELLCMDEVPLINDEYNIQGHTDGYLNLDEGEIAILEIKSINSRGFAELTDAKEEHKLQGLVYLYCAAERQAALHNAYDTEEEFNASYDERREYFISRYQHMKGGRRYTREQKIENEVQLNLLSDNILWHTNPLVNKVIFLYENKDTQELKEFVLERTISVEPMLTDILKGYQYLNECCAENIVPPRPEGASKSGYNCRWCSYKNTCFVV